MSSPDSWVRSAYTVFWSRPGSNSHDYQPLGVTRRPRPRRLRAWLPLAVLLLVAVLSLSTLGLVHRPGKPLADGREASDQLTPSEDSGSGHEAAAGEVLAGGLVSGLGEGGQVKNGHSAEKRVKGGQGGKQPVSSRRKGAPPEVSGGNSDDSAGGDGDGGSDSGVGMGGSGGDQASRPQHQRSAPQEVLVVLKPAGIAESDADASGNGVPPSGD